MSTTDPDARGQAIQSALRPAAVVALVIALLAGPAAGLVMRTTRNPDAAFVGVYLVWLALVVGGGLFGYYTLKRISALSIAAYCVAGLGGMFIIFTTGATGLGASAQASSVFIVLVPYVIAAVLYSLHLRRTVVQSATTADGVNTDAEVTRVGVSGMYNYVQIFHLTLKFVDNQGTTRYFRTHQTSVGGWSIGDKIPIRYSAQHPSWKSAIIVNP